MDRARSYHGQGYGFKSRRGHHLSLFDEDGQEQLQTRRAGKADRPILGIGEARPRVGSNPIAATSWDLTQIRR